ncbi:MAG: hypothetical protein VB080_07880 [Propionicimonas sp.]|uniref:hypothetical protein n=1 Tax=Propionicimonas sp. TaxID=1955623 RepID=UPI002B202BF9|nr:hypothetical protein [Propionicimonas sp.]MEA4944343.1 hypothetical protein [Propionicimonas sp.]
MWAVDGLRSWFRRTTGAAALGSDLSLSPQDARELAELAVRVASEFSAWSPEVIAGSLGRLLRRRVPLRAVRGREGAPGVGDLCFADGTVVIVRAEHPGELGRVAVGLLAGGVVLSCFAAERDQVVIEIGILQRRLRMTALGVLQPR